jgi:hypothetical protein
MLGKHASAITNARNSRTVGGGIVYAVRAEVVRQPPRGGGEKDRLVLSSERAPNNNKPETVRQKKKSGLKSQMGFDTKTD